MKKITIFFIMWCDFLIAQHDTIRLDSIYNFGEVLPNLTNAFQLFQNQFDKDGFYIVNSRIKDTLLMKGEIKNQKPIGIWFFNNLLLKKKYVIDFKSDTESYNVLGYNSKNELIYEFYKMNNYKIEKIINENEILINESEIKNDKNIIDRWLQFRNGNLESFFYEDSMNVIDEKYNNSKIFKTKYYNNKLKDSIWRYYVSNCGIYINLYYSNNKIVAVNINDSSYLIKSNGDFHINFNLNDYLIKIEILDSELNGEFSIVSIFDKLIYIKEDYVNGNLKNMDYSHLNWN